LIAKLHKEKYMRSALTAVSLLVVASAVSAQAAQKASGANPATEGLTKIYAEVKANVLKTADQVPEDKYSYRPTPQVRTLGQILAHIADAQNNVCAAAAGDVKPYNDNIEKTAKTKAAIIAALKASFTACDAAYAKTTDAGLSKMTSVFGAQQTVSNALTLNTAHDWEHYGNLVTYMRMLGMVPPSSQGN
jgi:uncharacterized damage-inducible protein DinB